MDTCAWDDCDEPQFKYFYYCEHHAKRVSMMNSFFSSIVGGR